MKALLEWVGVKGAGLQSAVSKFSHVGDVKAAGAGAKTFVGWPPFSEVWGIGFLPPSHRYSHSTFNDLP